VRAIEATGKQGGLFAHEVLQRTEVADEALLFALLDVNSILKKLVHMVEPILLLPDLLVLLRHFDERGFQILHVFVFLVESAFQLLVDIPKGLVVAPLLSQLELDLQKERTQAALPLAELRDLVYEVHPLDLHCFSDELLEPCFHQRQGHPFEVGKEHRLLVSGWSADYDFFL